MDNYDSNHTDYIVSLIRKHRKDNLTIQERAALAAWLNDDERNSALLAELNDEARQREGARIIHDFATNGHLDAVLARYGHPAPVRHLENPKRKWYAVVAVAAFLFAFGMGVWLNGGLFSEKRNVLSADVHPGGNRAALTLADGSIIDVDSAASGLLARQQGIRIFKDEDGTITYEQQNNGQYLPETAFNTITTPKGGQYRVILPDLSCVWLNAASSLRYPIRFSGAERRVELSGEAYFEVARNDRQPFVVQSNGQEVKVLGTQFNINAYDDESVVTTTLVDGSIAIVHLGQDGTILSHTLTPHQQATLSNGSISITEVDIQPFTAWKNGQFVFRNTELDAILRQLERWYDIEVDYTTLPDERFYGRMSRNVKLSEILNMLEVTSNIHFTIEERRLILEK